MGTGKRIAESVKNGSLVDVSHVARRVGLPCPAFVTKTFWELAEINCSEEQVAAVLNTSSYIRSFVGEGRTGQVRAGVALLEGLVCMNILVERFDGQTLTITIGDHSEVLDFAAEGISSAGAPLM